MIRGEVNASREARLELAVIGRSGRRSVSAIVDTGFSGFLTLPSSLVADLDLDWLFREQAILGDGSRQVFDVFAGEVEWGAERRSIAVLASEATPLIGMSLLAGQKLEIDVINGGAVILNRL